LRIEDNGLGHFEHGIRLRCEVGENTWRGVFSRCSDQQIFGRFRFECLIGRSGEFGIVASGQCDEDFQQLVLLKRQHAARRRQPRRLRRGASDDRLYDGII